MDETIYVIFKIQFDFALEVWFSIYIATRILPSTDCCRGVVSPYSSLATYFHRDDSLHTACPSICQ